MSKVGFFEEIKEQPYFDWSQYSTITDEEEKETNYSDDPNSALTTPKPDPRRSFVDRTFSPLQKGSIRGSIMSMVSAAVGGGVLSLPYVFCLSGWAVGVALILLGAGAGIWSNSLIAEVAIEKNLVNFD
jgi:VIT1/CCC1 family predicted Fe2+/Mn2+ transporter